MALLLLCLLNVGIDFIFTRRRMKKYGQAVEMAASIRFLSTHFGRVNGLLLGLILPQVTIAVICYSFFPTLLGVFCGMCLWRSYSQFLSLGLEKEIDKLIRPKMGL